MKTQVQAHASFFSVVVLAVLFYGCPPINNTGLGSCFLGGTGCIGGAPPGVVLQQEQNGSGGFDVYTLFDVDTIPEDFRADTIHGVSGHFLSAGATTYGTETSFGPEDSGNQVGTAPPGVTVNSGLVISANGKVGVTGDPSQWVIYWGTTGFDSQWAGYLQRTFGPLQDQKGQQWPHFCNGGTYSTIANVAVADTVGITCEISSCFCNIAGAGIEATTQQTLVQPNVEEVGNIVNMVISPLHPPSGGFSFGNVGAMIYDSGGNSVGCAGFNPPPVEQVNQYGVGCYGFLAAIGGPGNTQFTIAPGGLAYWDFNKPGDYYAQIQVRTGPNTQQNPYGTWANTDVFGFAIREGGVPVYRYYSPSHGTHCWSTVTVDCPNEWPYDYRSEGIGFYVYPHGVAFAPFGNALSTYRLSCCQGGGNGAWLLTDSATEQQNANNAGWLTSGILGDIMATNEQWCTGPTCSTYNTALYRTWVQTNGNANFMFTDSYTEYQNMLNGGWHDQGVSGYVPTGP